MVKDLIKWLYWYPLRWIVQRLPFRAVYLLADLGGAVLYLFSKRKRKALEEAAHVLNGAADEKMRRHMVRRALAIFCQNESEVLLFPKLTPGLTKKVVGCEGMEHLDKSLQNGSGAMLLFAHFGANQMIMPAIGYQGYKMSQLSAPPTVWEQKLPNRHFSRISKRSLELRLAHELSLPVKHINVFGSLKEAFLCLRRNEVLGIAMDGGGGSAGVVVDFLGKKARFSTGAFEIAQRTGCAVLPTFMIRGSDGRNHMIIEQPLTIKKNEADSAEKCVTAFVRKLEEYVYKYPCHYLNFVALRIFMERQGDTPFFLNEEYQKESSAGKAVLP